MTEARRKRPGPAPVLWASLATFLALFAGLSIQLRNGHDPALGAAKEGVQQPKEVLVRRVILRRVIVDEPAGPTVAAPAAGPAPARGSNAAAPAASTAPVAAATPAPAPAPAPVPPPAPVTRSS